jgi:hypothetical protein
VHRGAVLNRHHVFALQAAVPELRECRVGVGQQALPVGGINPRPRDHARTVARTNLVFVGIDQGIEGFSIDQSLFHQQRLEGLDAQCWVRWDRLLPLTVLLGLSLGADRGRRGPGGRHGSHQETSSGFVHRMFLPFSLGENATPVDGPCVRELDYPRFLRRNA